MLYQSILILFIWLGAAIFNLFKIRQKGKLMYVNIVASIFILIGGVGFFGRSFAYFYPLEKEWPMGKNEHVIKTGKNYVTIDDWTGRVQV